MKSHKKETGESERQRSFLTRAIFGGPELVDLLLRSQPKLLASRKEYELAKRFISGAGAEEVRERFRTIARETASEAVRFWLNHFGLEMGRGGRPRKNQFEDTRAHPIGRMVDLTIRDLGDGFARKRKMKKEHASQINIETALAQMHLNSKQRTAIMHSKTLRGAACAYVASLQKPELRLKTVQNAYSLYRRHADHEG